MTRSMFFLISLTTVVIILFALASFYLARLRRVSTADWSSLISRLIVVEKENIALVALDLLDDKPTPDNGALELEPSQIWDLIGGMDGLKALEKNCDVLVDLASYIQCWYPEAVVTAEQLRLNAREIKWHIGRLQGATSTGNLLTSFPDYAQRAVTTYYQMTKHLLFLYRESGCSQYADLQRALEPFMPPRGA